MKKIFNVAGFTFSVDTGDMHYPELWNNLTNYRPFEVCGTVHDADLIFRLQIRGKRKDVSVGQGECIAVCDNEVASISVYREDVDKCNIFIAQCKELKHDGGVLAINKAIGAVGLYWDEKVTLRNKLFILNNALILLFAMFTARRETLLMHASVIIHKGKAFMFLGKSGTGKSTHSRLWLQHIREVELLNDDNPVIRVMGGKVWAYGSPWSGKTSCYKNEHAQLGALVRLYQAPVNRMEKLEGIAAYVAILPSASGMKWDKRLAAGMHDTLAEVARLIPVYQLHCLPDAEAVRLCYEQVS